MKTVVINLAHRKDRRREMEAQLSAIGWAAEFFEAIRPESENGFPSIGARGCFESHLAVLRAARGSDLVLMEDDLNLVPNFQLQWHTAMRNLPKDWSILYPAHDLDESGLLSPTKSILCSHMVVFRASAIERIITELETIMSRPPGHPLGGPMHVDGAYNTIRAQNQDIKTYGLSPPLGYQRSSMSDISAPRWIDNYPNLAAVARKSKSLLKSRFGLLHMNSFRSFIALPFHCIGVLFLAFSMVFFGVGAGIDPQEDERDEDTGPASFRNRPFKRR